MPNRYKELTEEWREAAACTRDAQQRLKEAFDAHIAGGPPPDEEDVLRLRALRELEVARLDRAMDYLRQTAAVTRPGELS